MKKAILLLSDGIDSPVAAYLMKDKVSIIALNFVNGPGQDSKKIRQLAKAAEITKIYSINSITSQEEFAEKCNRRFQCILCKRIMYRIAEEIAKKEKACFILTGENLSQVASQTLDNMAVLTEAIKIPIIRPLLCMDKREIISIARKAGTYDISIKEQHRCPFVPEKPLTRAAIEKVLEEEKKVNIKKRVKDSLISAEVITV